MTYEEVKQNIERLLLLIQYSGFGITKASSINKWPSGLRVGLMFTYKVHSVFSQPVKALEEEQQREKGHKAGRKVVPEDCKG